MKKLTLITTYLKTKYKKIKTKEELKKHQLKQFNIFKKNVLINSPYYSKYIDCELNEFPIINKTIMMNNFDLINTKKLNKNKCLNIAIKSEENRDFSPMINDISVGLSSGTSGNKGLFVATEKERMQWAGIILAKVLDDSLLKKQKVALFLRANNNLYESIKSSHISFEFYDLLIPFELLIKELNIQKPTILIAPSQVLKMITKEQERGTLNINPKKIISAAEVLEDNDKIYIESIFNKKVDNIYQCTEGFLGTTCSEGHLHINEDIIILEKEWVDKKKNRFIPIITDTIRSTQPIIRYRLDDILIEKNSACACGSPFIALEKVEGRSDDILILKTLENEEKKIFPDFIRNKIIINDDKIKDYKINQITFDKIEVSVDSKNKEKSLNKIKETLLNYFNNENLKEPEIIFKEFIKNENISIKKQRIKRLF